jgi:hypothetical protein
MSSTSKVGATTPSSGIPVSARTAVDAAASTLSRVEGVSGVAPVGFSGHWRPTYGDAFAEAGYDRLSSAATGDEQAQFTPLVARLAASFPASQMGGDSRLNPAFLLGDLARAVGVYEFNMRLLAGAYAAQGSVINHFS